MPRLRGPNEIALTPPSTSLPGTLYEELVAIYARWIPPYRFQTVPRRRKGTGWPPHSD